MWALRASWTTPGETFGASLFWFGIFHVHLLHLLQLCRRMLQVYFFYCKTPKMFRWPWRVTTCPQAWRWEEDAWMFLFGWTFPLREYITRKFSSDPSGLVGTAFCQTDLHLAKQKGNCWTSLAAQLNRHFFDRKINFRSLSLEDWNDIISNPNFICLSSGEWNALAALDDSRWASEAGDLSHRLTRRFNRCQRLMIDSI